MGKQFFLLKEKKIFQINITRDKKEKKKKKKNKKYCSYYFVTDHSNYDFRMFCRKN